MEWVGECEQATLSATRAIEQQTQLIHNIQEQTQPDVCQELQCHRVEVLQDIQFQLNLLAKESHRSFKTLRSTTSSVGMAAISMTNMIKTAILE